jgi:hypothetical protein
MFTGGKVDMLQLLAAYQKTETTRVHTLACHPRAEITTASDFRLAATSSHGASPTVPATQRRHNQRYGVGG